MQVSAAPLNVERSTFGAPALEHPPRFTVVYPSGREAHPLQRWDERPRFSGFSPRWCAASACLPAGRLANIRSLWYTCSCARHSDGTAEQRFAPYQLKVGGCGKNVPLPRKTLTGCTNLAACQPANGPPFQPRVSWRQVGGSTDATKSGRTSPIR